MDLPQNLASLPLGHLLERIAGDRPLLPAAGSATALVGATAAAMGGFVSRIARRHAETDTASRAIDPIVDAFDRLCRHFADLISEDVRAYSDAMAAMRRKAGDPEAARRKMIGPPEAMAVGGLEMLALLDRLLPDVYEPARADFAVAFELAISCIDSAVTILRTSVRTSDPTACSDPLSLRIASLTRTRDEFCSRLRRAF